MANQKQELNKIIESLSPNERAIMPYLDKKTMQEIYEESGLDKTTILRALEFLSNKKIIKITTKQEKIIELGINGLLYIKQGLPERKLANLISEKTSISIQDAKKQSGLNSNEFTAALGALKRKALINLINGNIILTGKKENLIEKTLEEKFLEQLPKNIKDLQPEEKLAFEKLKSRKNIIDIQDKKIINFSKTELGEELSKEKIPAIEMIETITPNLIKTGQWKGKKFRRYDITSPTPKISGGKQHFTKQAIDYAKKIWVEMGFKEMTGNMIESSFWNFDALFTAQDHPARELQDTFFIKNKIAKLPDKKIIQGIKNAHEGKIKGSKGLGYKWKEDDAKKVILRTHTTCLSARTLSKLKSEKLPAKFFSVAKCFRNETVDWSHGFEFYQTEGIVVDKNANLRHLLGYLKQFAEKMGFKKIRFRPHYFPYTEPSVEGDVWDEKKKKWVEVFAAGIFRPEVTEPLLGKPLPVLAWGLGYGRMIMQLYKLTDLRDLYKNDINQLRNIKFLEK